jgi:hypothetical protein
MDGAIFKKLIAILAGYAADCRTSGGRTHAIPPLPTPLAPLAGGWE